MNATSRGILAGVVAWALLLALAPPLAAMPTGPGGVVLGLDGAPARGHRVQLLDADGRVHATAETDERGRYRFGPVADERYRLAVVTPEGVAVPVLGGPQVNGTSRSLAPVRLVAFDPTGLDPALVHAQKVAGWWRKMPTTGRVLVIVGVVAGVGLGVAALSGGGETPASQF
jgi:hypothetical protein